MENKENTDVAEMFSKMGEKLGWFQYGDVNSAIKSLSKSSRKKSNRSRLKKSETTNENDEKNDYDSHRNEPELIPVICHDQEPEIVSKKSSRNKNVIRVLKESNDINCEQKETDISLKPSSGHTNLRKALDLSGRSCSSDNSISPPKSSQDLSDISICDFSRVDDIGLPIVESTRIHRSSVYYSCLETSTSSSNKSNSVDNEKTTDCSDTNADSFKQLNIFRERSKDFKGKTKVLSNFDNCLEFNKEKRNQSEIINQINCLDISDDGNYDIKNGNVDSENVDSESVFHENDPTVENFVGYNDDTKFISFYSTSDNTSNDSELSVLVQDQSIQVDFSCSLDELYQSSIQNTTRKISKSSSSSSEGSYVEVIDVSVQINIDGADDSLIDDDGCNVTHISPEISLSSDIPAASCPSSSLMSGSYSLDEDTQISGSAKNISDRDSLVEEIHYDEPCGVGDKKESAEISSRDQKDKAAKVHDLEEALGSDDDYLYTHTKINEKTKLSKNKKCNNGARKKTESVSSDDSWCDKKTSQARRKQVSEEEIEPTRKESFCKFIDETVETQQKKSKHSSLKKNRTKSKQHNLNNTDSDKCFTTDGLYDHEHAQQTSDRRRKNHRKNIKSVSSDDSSGGRKRTYKQGKRNTKFDTDSEEDEAFYSFLNETSKTEQRRSKSATQKKAGVNKITEIENKVSDWRTKKKYSSSSNEDDDKFEAFLQKVKAQSKQPVESSSDGLDNFIVDDDDVSSASDDSLFYITTTQAMNDESTSDQSIVCLESSKDEKSSQNDDISGDSSSSSDDSDGNDESSDDENESSDKDKSENIFKPLPTFRTPSIPKARTSKIDSTKKPSRTIGSVQPASAPKTPCKETFLKSLSMDVPVDVKHPDAIKFATNFNKHKEELTMNLFHLYNKTVFDSQIPDNIPVIWNKRLLKTAGYCIYKKDSSAKFGRSVRIELSTKVCDTTERVRDTLIHEMCHAAVWLLTGNNEGHGPYWKYWARKSNITHPELPIINRCHNYSINCRYTYKCTKCGYSIGHHSKSLDIAKKVCGYCHGHFELVDNKKKGTNQTKDSASTPRTPNKFAMYVKENYASIKKSNKGVKHGELMSMLSKQFAEQKLS